MLSAALAPAILAIPAPLNQLQGLHDLTTQHGAMANINATEVWSTNAPDVM